ncbi:MAG: DUF1232 domain-containing protein [Anaerolineales bacterium]|nr:DUF1232 domain-containing protein [Anaerolineales bacterium]
MLKRLRDQARALKQEACAVYLALRDPRPWYMKAFAALILAHTFSPIDLIPDFIPVLGQMDDLIITPLGLALAVRMIPAAVMAEARGRSAEMPPRNLGRAGMIVILAVWLVIALVMVRLWLLPAT